VAVGREKVLQWGAACSGFVRDGFMVRVFLYCLSKFAKLPPFL